MVVMSLTQMMMQNARNFSSEFLLQLKNQMWENKIEYKGNYNLDIDAREYQQNDTVFIGNYFQITKIKTSVGTSIK